MVNLAYNVLKSCDIVLCWYWRIAAVCVELVILF